MAISEEAMDYLHEIENVTNWTKIPDDDMRIVKLRLLFGIETEKIPEHVPKKEGRGGNGGQNRLTGEYGLYQKGKLLAKGTIEEIAVQLGIARTSVVNYNAKGYQSRAKNPRKLVKLEVE